MEVASSAGAYGCISQELRGGGGEAAVQSWPKWLLGAAAGCGHPRGWGPGGCPEESLCLGGAWAPRLRALERGEGAARTGTRTEPASAPMGNCMGWLCLIPGDQVCAGVWAGWEGQAEGELSCLPVSEAEKELHDKVWT